jgi:hypothetical protein
MIGRGDYGGGSNENRWDILDRIAPEVERVLRRSAIDPHDFDDLYGVDNVNRDIAEAESLKALFAARDAKRPELARYQRRARFFEAVVCSGDENDWFGPEATVVRTAEYDDYKGVDAVLELTHSDNPTHIALAIDVAEMGQIEDKLKHIRENIQRGKMARVKYFVSDQGFRGELSKIPEVIVAAFGDDLYELSLLWAQKSGRDAIAKHPIQLQLLEEIRIQLVSFRAFAAFLERNDLLPAYDRVLTIVEGIIEIKRPLEEELKKAGTWNRADNPSLRSMKKNIAAIFPEIAESVQL